MSSYQSLVLEKVKKLFNSPHFEIKVNYKPDFMKSPRTGRRLELDICVFVRNMNERVLTYTDVPDLAFEVQGEQHFQNVKWFKSNSDFIKMNDLYKMELCNKSEVPLIEIFYTDIDKDLNILKIIINQLNHFSKFKGKRQINKIKKCLNIIKFNLYRDTDLNAWLKKHEETPPPKDTYMDRFITKLEKSLHPKRKRKKKKKPTNQTQS